MRKIAVAAMKGGVGKTMVTLNVAGCLAERCRILVVDADAQGNATSGLGMDIADVDRPSMVEVLAQDAPDPEEVVVRRPVPALGNLDAIPSSILLHRQEQGLFTRASRELVLSRYFERHAGFFSAYDYVFIDTAPGLSLVNQNAFATSDSIVLVSDVSLNGFIGVELFCDLWGIMRADLGLEDNIGALVVNLFDRRLKMASEFMSDCEQAESTAHLLVKPPVPQRVAYKDTEISAEPINICHPGSEEHETVLRVIGALSEKGVL